MIIPYSEIQEILKGSYISDGEDILVKHSVYRGEREFALVLIERCMGLLSQETINDKFIVQYLQGLLSLTDIESKHYEIFLDTFVKDLSLKEQALLGEKLSANEVVMLKE